MTIIAQLSFIFIVFSMWQIDNQNFVIDFLDENIIFILIINYFWLFQKLIWVINYFSKCIVCHKNSFFTKKLILLTFLLAFVEKFCQFFLSKLSLWYTWLCVGFILFVVILRVCFFDKLIWERGRGRDWMNLRVKLMLFLFK